MWFGSHFTFGVTRRLLLSSRVSLLVINLLTIQERVREKRQGMKLIWGPIYFQAVLKYCGRFFHEIHSNNSLRDKMYGGHFFLFKIKIFVLKMVANWFLTFDYLTGPEVNFAFDVWKLLELSAWFWDCFKFDCIYIQILSCCFRFNGMVIVECYLAWHCL